MTRLAVAVGVVVGVGVVRSALQVAGAWGAAAREIEGRLDAGRELGVTRIGSDGARP